MVVLPDLRLGIIMLVSRHSLAMRRSSMAGQPTIAIPLDLPDVRVLRSELTKQQELIIELESTLTSAVCRRCGRTITEFYAFDQPLKLRHLPVLGYVVYIRIRPKRFRCPYCDDHPTTTQRLSWYEPRATHTTAYDHHLLVQLVNSTIEDVCQKEDTSYEVILGTLDRWIATEPDWDTLPSFTTLGIDEIALKKGHRDFVTIVSARLPTARLVVLAVLPDRTKATLIEWLEKLPTGIQQQIRTVCIDMWEGFVSALQEVLPKARLVIDRYHVATHYHDCADTLRKQEVKRLHKQLAPEEAEQLKQTMWPFRKRKADLEQHERDRLVRLLELSPQVKQAYDLREALTNIFDTARTKAEGLKQIKRWRRQVQASGLECFDPFLRLLDSWLDLIANYFVERQSSAFVEGLNNKIKVLKRRCFGLFNLSHLFQRITLDLEGYRRFSRWHGAYH
jgi:transposase